jgi:hypothetical protein
MWIMQLERLIARTSLMMRLTIADCFTPMSVIGVTTRKCILRRLAACRTEFSAKFL